MDDICDGTMCVLPLLAVVCFFPTVLWCCWCVSRLCLAPESRIALLLFDLAPLSSTRWLCLFVVSLLLSSVASILSLNDWKSMLYTLSVLSLVALQCMWCLISVSIVYRRAPFVQMICLRCSSMFVLGSWIALMIYARDSNLHVIWLMMIICSGAVWFVVSVLGDYVLLESSRRLSNEFEYV